MELASFCPELGLGLEMGLEGSWSDVIFSLGFEEEVGDSEDDGLGVRDEPGFPVGSLDMGMGSSPELWLGLDPLRWSEDGLVLGNEAEEGLGVDVALGLVAVDDAVIAGLDTGLLVVGLTVLLPSLSLR